MNEEYIKRLKELAEDLELFAEEKLQMRSEMMLLSKIKYLVGYIEALPLPPSPKEHIGE